MKLHAGQKEVMETEHSEVNDTVVIAIEDCLNLKGRKMSGVPRNSQIQESQSKLAHSNTVSCP